MLVVDCISSSPQCSFALLFLPEPNGAVSAQEIFSTLWTGWEEGESLTLENEDAVAMGTVDPSVTQRVPGW